MKVDVKTRSEIDRMREACRMSAEIRDICAAAVAPGVTTGEIDDLVVAYCAKHKVTASFYNFEGFPGHLCVSINDEVIHGIPSRHRVIMPGDLVKTDVGICTKGFHGDTSRTVMLSVTDPETIRLVEPTKAFRLPSASISRVSGVQVNVPPPRVAPSSVVPDSLAVLISVARAAASVAEE